MQNDNFHWMKGKNKAKLCASDCLHLVTYVHVVFLKSLKLEQFFELSEFYVSLVREGRHEMHEDNKLVSFTTTLDFSPIVSNGQDPLL